MGEKNIWSPSVHQRQQAACSGQNVSSRQRGSARRSAIIPPPHVVAAVAAAARRSPPTNASLDDSLSTPCKQMNSLQLKSKPKTSRLLSSKSLSQLVPRSLFFIKARNTSKSNDSSSTSDAPKLATVKSFPVAGTNAQRLVGAQTQKPPKPAQRFSLVGAKCSPTYQSQNGSLEQPNISPIMGLNPFLDQDEAHSYRMSSTVANVPQPDPSGKPDKRSNAGSGSMEGSPKEAGAKDKKSTGSKPFKSLRSTTLVLRDVKNSIGLRMKAKQESKAFARLTNDATPSSSVKLYSPFHIYDDLDSALKKGSNKAKEPTRSKRRLNWITNQGKTSDKSGCGHNDSSASNETPKRRIALRHKEHLLRINKFDSPTGRLRETVKEVEQFQQCIEDISKAIRAREPSR